MISNFFSIGQYCSLSIRLVGQVELLSLEKVLQNDKVKYKNTLCMSYLPIKVTKTSNQRNYQSIFCPIQKIMNSRRIKAQKRRYIVFIIFYIKKNESNQQTRCHTEKSIYSALLVRVNNTFLCFVPNYRMMVLILSNIYYIQLSYYILKTYTVDEKLDFQRKIISNSQIKSCIDEKAIVGNLIELFIDPSYPSKRQQSSLHCSNFVSNQVFGQNIFPNFP